MTAQTMGLPSTSAHTADREPHSLWPAEAGCVHTYTSVWQSVSRGCFVLYTCAAALWGVATCRRDVGLQMEAIRRQLLKRAAGRALIDPAPASVHVD